MIAYIGTPITPVEACAKVLFGRHALVSFHHPTQIQLVASTAESFIIDNGAFSSWRSGQPVTDWTNYYAWSEEWLHHPACDWAIIPDIIDGDERANDALIAQWPHKDRGAPVWHMHEDIKRLKRLCTFHRRVCIGSSAQFSTPGTDNWWRRIEQALNAICINGSPPSKLHGLRMLRRDIVESIPFSSADSAMIALTIGRDNQWKGTYLPESRVSKAVVLAMRSDGMISPASWTSRPEQLNLFGQLYED